MSESEEHQYLREQLVLKAKNLPRNLTELLLLLEMIHNYPGTTTSSLLVQSGLPDATFFRYMKWLRENDLITKNNRVNFGTNDRTFLIPNSIRRGVLPDDGPYTHLAAYLSKFAPDDVVPPFGRTRSDIMAQVKKQLEKSGEKTHRLVVGIMEGLAAYSIMQGNVSAFSNMLGNLDPPTKLEDL